MAENSFSGDEEDYEGAVAGSKTNFSPVANRHSLCRALQVARRAMLITQLMITLVALLVGGMLAGLPGMLTVLVVTIIAMVVIVVTSLVNSFTYRRPHQLTLWVLGGYVAKLILVLGGYLGASELSFFQPRLGVVTLVVSFLLVGMVESRILMRRSLLLIDPLPGQE